MMFKKMKELNFLSFCLFRFLFCLSFYFATENGNILYSRLICNVLCPFLKTVL